MKPKSERKPTIRVVAGVALKNGSILVTRRPAGKPYPDRWEFPGGKVEKGETDTEALVRELSEELNVRVDIGEKIGSYGWEYPEKRVDLHFYSIRVVEGEPVPVGVAEILWVDPAETDQLDFLEADLELLKRLRERDNGGTDAK